ncbi:MAG: hypothetical protein VX246_14755 [Myxococcota bacterium]|nr:hypothetical protein [Myxococcota bacterium]
MEAAEAHSSKEEGERRCDECSLCCTVLRVDPLRKLGGVTCVHQKVGSKASCEIHERPERPALCGAYRCSWLLGRFTPDDRPDRLGAVLDFGSHGGVPVLTIRESAVGVFDASPRLREIAEEVRESMPVRITSADDVMNADREYRILEAGGEELRVSGDRVERWFEGERQGTERIPPFERWLRRFTLTWKRWRLRGYRGEGDGSREPGEESVQSRVGGN